MDWELYERYRATLSLMGVVFVSFLLLTFQRTSPVRHIRTILVTLTLPTERFLSRMKSTDRPVDDAAPTPAPSAPLTVNSDATTVVAPAVTASSPAPSWSATPETTREIQVLKEENKRLRDLVSLRETSHPTAIAAHVAGRDPHRWFQELVLDKGKQDGIEVDNPVLAVVNNREALVGRIVEVGDSVSKVMLIEDSLSAVAARVQRTPLEDGVVEGNNSHDLFLRYLDRGSSIKIGDAVVTSGLGGVFPEGIAIGWVDDLGLDPRQLFLQARLRPAMLEMSLNVVLVLINADKPHL